MLPPNWNSPSREQGGRTRVALSVLSAVLPFKTKQWPVTGLLRCACFLREETDLLFPWLLHRYMGATSPEGTANARKAESRRSCRKHVVCHTDNVEFSCKSDKAELAISSEMEIRRIGLQKIGFAGTQTTGRKLMSQKAPIAESSVPTSEERGLKLFAPETLSVGLDCVLQIVFWFTGIRREDIPLGLRSGAGPEPELARRDVRRLTLTGHNSIIDVDLGVSTGDRVRCREANLLVLMCRQR